MRIKTLNFVFEDEIMLTFFFIEQYWNGKSDVGSCLYKKKYIILRNNITMFVVIILK